MINAVAAEAGDRLKFQVVHDQSFFAALDTQHKTFTPTCDYDTYLRILGKSEVCFMPLGDTAFNRAKSDLKFIEAEQCRITGALWPARSCTPTESRRAPGSAVRDPTGFHSKLFTSRRDAGARSASRRRGPPVCSGSSHAGVSGGAPDRLVPVALGPAGGLGGGAPGAYRASYGRLRLGRVQAERKRSARSSTTVFTSLFQSG